MKQYPPMITVRRIEVDIPIRALKTANIYLVDSGSSRILVDSGMEKSALGKILPVLDNEKPDYIFLTHMHIDHIGNSMALKERYESKVIIGEGDNQRIRHIQDEPDFFRKMISGLFRESGVPDSITGRIVNSHSLIENLKSYEEFEADLTVKEELSIEKGIMVSVNPGHSPGSASLLLNGNDSIMTGDHILPGITPNISFYDYETDSLGDYLRSLNKTSRLNLTHVYPGHREPFEGLTKRCMEIKEHHERRLKEIHDLLSRPLTAFDVASGMKWSKGRTLDSMNTTEQNFAIGEAITHLVYLERKGKIEKTERGGINYYRLN